MMTDKLTIISADGCAHSFNEMGIKALRRIYKETPELLNAAEVSDIVVGKGAAAFMICGKVRRINAGVLSEGAKQMLTEADIPYTAEIIVPQIKNKENCKQCGIESLLTDTLDPSECIKRISRHFNDAWSI